MSKILVTVSNSRRTFSFDMELPSDCESTKLQEDINEVLSYYAPEIVPTIMNKHLYLYNKKAYMRPGETLDSYGVENGEFILLE